MFSINVKLFENDKEVLVVIFAATISYFDKAGFKIFGQVNDVQLENNN